MSKLFSALRDKEQRDRAEWIIHYREILLIGDAATSEQINELQELMDKLGFNSVKVKADAEALAFRSKLIAKVKSLPARKEAMDKSRAQHAAWCDEAERTFKELAAKTESLLQAKHATERDFGEAMNARRKLIELSRANLELFGTMEKFIGSNASKSA